MKMLTVSLLFVPLVPLVAATCYYPSGGISPGDVACRSDTDQSACCGQGYACLSNGLCQAVAQDILGSNGNSIYARGSCTDKTWKSKECPNYCVNPKYDQLDGGAGMGECAGSNTTFYCIDAEQSDCDSKLNVLVFSQAPTPITTIAEPSAGSSSVTASKSLVFSTKVTSTKGSPATTAATTTTTVATTATTSTTSHISTQAEAAASTNPSTTNGPTQTAAPSKGQSSQSARNIGIGVGVGVGGLGLIALATALIILRRRRSAKDVASESQMPFQSENKDHFYDPQKTEPTELYQDHRGYYATQVHEAPPGLGRYELGS